MVNAIRFVPMVLYLQRRRFSNEYGSSWDKFLGIPMVNPIMGASGTFGFGVEYEDF